VGPPKPSDDDLTRFMESKLGAASNVLEEDKLKQFLVNDRKVLRFFCSWDDRDSLYGEKRPFIIHYFLADDTVEVLEVNKPNSGRDPFPMFFRRAKLPKEKTATDLGFSQAASHTVQYYSDKDLCVGATVNVLGRSFTAYDADDFTRAYYGDRYGMSMPGGQSTGDDGMVRPTPKLQPPPYNGFGSEEDSLGSFLYLTPKVRKQKRNQPAVFGWLFAQGRLRLPSSHRLRLSFAPTPPL
jgi:hypothetical protein